MTALLDLVPALQGFSPPAGDPVAVRTAAVGLRRTAERQEAAADRLARVGAELPCSWSGDAASAARKALSLLADSVEDEAGRHQQAAGALDVCAARLEDAIATWEKAEALERQDALERSARRAAAVSGAFVGPYEVDATPLRQHARRLAAEAVTDAADAQHRAATALDALTERSHRGRLTLGQQVAGVGRGALTSVWGTFTTLAALSVPRLVLDPEGYGDDLTALVNGLAVAVTHPRDAAAALVGLDELADGRYGEWLGALVPDLVGGVLTGGTAPAASRGLHVADELADLSDDVSDLQRVTRRLPSDAGGPVELRDGAAVPDGYVTFVEDLTPERRRHILVGDARGGGHRAGAGKGKSEFPASWSDDRIIEAVMDTARHPDVVVWHPLHRSWNAQAVHDGVTVQVAIDPRGWVRTGFPLEGPGVRHRT